MMNKDRIILYCDRAIAVCLCLSIFCLPFAKAGVEAFVWFAFFLWILKRAMGYRGKACWGMLPATELNKALGVFIAVNAISMIFSVNFGLSLRGLFGKELKFMAIYFMLVETINSRERLKNILMVIIASAVLLATDAAVQYFRGIDFLRGYPLGQLNASFQTANGFGGWLAVIILLFLGMLTADKILSKKLKVLLAVLIIILLICLVMAYSRGAWVGFVAGFLLMVFYAIKNYTLKIKILCLGAGICLLGIFLFLPQPMKAKIKTISQFNFKCKWAIGERIKSIFNMKQSSNAERFRLWKYSSRITRDYLLTGCGLNTYSVVIPHYTDPKDASIYAHNCFFQMAAETGLLGLFAFLWVLFRFFKMGFKNLNRTMNPLVLGLLTGILAFLVQSFFDVNLYALQLVVLFWFMLGLAVAVIKLDNDAGK